MTVSIKNTVERTRQYWYIDGFSELLVGAIFVFLGLLNCASLIIRPSIGSAVIVGIGYPLVILGGILFGNKWVRSMKEKVTYPHRICEIYPTRKPFTQGANDKSNDYCFYGFHRY